MVKVTEDETNQSPPLCLMIILSS